MTQRAKEISGSAVCDAWRSIIGRLTAVSQLLCACLVARLSAAVRTRQPDGDQVIVRAGSHAHLSWRPPALYGFGASNPVLKAVHLHARTGPPHDDGASRTAHALAGQPAQPPNISIPNAIELQKPWTGARNAAGAGSPALLLPGRAPEGEGPAAVRKAMRPRNA